MMAALIAGQRDPTTLAQMARTRMRAKIRSSKRRSSVTSRITTHSR